MIKRITHITLAVWLSIVLLFGVTPKEFIHLFAHHTDTVEHYHTHGLYIEKEHHHCQFLCFSTTAFDNDQQLPRLHFSKPVSYITYRPFHLRSIQRAVTNLSLRGPPVV